MNEQEESLHHPGCYKIDPPIYLYADTTECNCGIDKARAEGYAQGLREAAEKVREYPIGERAHEYITRDRFDSPTWDEIVARINTEKGDLAAELERMADAT